MTNALRLIPLSPLLILFLPILASGCGGGGNNAAVSGKVSYNGAPVTGGTLKFYPEGSTEFTTGAIAPDGTFSFGGVPKGKMKVVVETESIKQQAKNSEKYKDKEGKSPPAPSGPTPVFVAIPIKYKVVETTDLTCEVKSSGNSFDFVLKD